MALLLYQDTFLYPDSSYQDSFPDLSRFFKTPVPADLTIDKFLVSYIKSEENWMNATVEEKERALKGATLFLSDRRWVGQVIIDDQELSWPRENLAYEDNFYGKEIRVSRGFLPTRLKKATELVALYVINNKVEQPLFLNESESDNYNHIRLGEAEYSSNHGSNIPILDRILSSLSPLLVSNSVKIYS